MSSPLRVAILTPNLTLGGAERWVLSLVRHFDPAQVVVTGVIVSGWGGIDTGMSREARLLTTLHSHNPGGRPEHARAYDPEGVQMHESLPAAIAYVCQTADVLLSWGDPSLGSVLPPGLPIPCVLTSHTTIDNDKQRPMHPQITHFAAVSQAAAAYFAGRAGSDGQPVTVIHNGAETWRLSPSRTRAEMRQQWGWSATDVVIGYVGRFCAEKNPGAAMRALSQLPAHFKAVHYGDPGHPSYTVTPALQAQAGACSGRAQLHVPVNQVGDVFHAVDVLMLASQREAASLTLLEAWLCGVPVVATPVGSVPELEAVHGQLTIPVGLAATAEELAAAVLLATGKVGQAIAHKTRTLAWSNFTAEQMAANWAAYLQTLVR